MRQITAVWLDMTTLCNRHCPECCCRIHERPHIAHPWAYFEHLAAFIYGVSHVHLTGGEPTAHPNFPEYIPRFRALFGCRGLSMWTNGYRLREYAAVLKYFDFVCASRYEDNGAAIDFLEQHHRHVHVWQGEHIPRSRRGSGAACERGLSHPGAAYADGRFFPCCVGPGIPGAASIAPSKDWARRVLTVPLPCENCWFSP